MQQLPLFFLLNKQDGDKRNKFTEKEEATDNS